MDAVIGSLRTQLLSHPLLLLLSLLVIGAIFGRRVAAAPRRLVTGSAAAALATYLLVVLWYQFEPQYFDHAEPSIAAVSWLAVNGGELYHAPDAAVCYAHPYGPLVYLTNGLALMVLGPGIAASKAAGIIAGLGSLGLLFIALAPLPSRERLPVTGFAAAGYLAFADMTFWTRAEPQLLFAVSMSLAALNRRRIVAAIVTGVAAGLGANLKITAALCFLPAAVYLWRQHGTSVLILTGLVAGVVFAAPFVLFGNVSWSGYVYWLSEAARHGFRLRSMPAQTQWAVVLLLPAAVAFVQHRRGHGGNAALQLARLATVVAIPLMIPFASKNGAGIHHFIPFVPAVAYVAARGGPLLPALAVATLTIAAVQQAYWIGTLARSPSRAPVAELRQFEATYGKPMAVGYSNAGYRLTFFRPVLVFEGNPYQLDAPALMGHELAGEPFPVAAIAAIQACSTRTWLIPAGGRPFDLASAYERGTPVFPPEFIAAFHGAYRRAESGRYFDVYRCADAAPGRPRSDP